MKARVGVLLGSLALAACAGTPHPTPGLLAPATEGVAPELLVTDTANAAISRGDQLQVTVYREPDLSLPNVTVDPAGNIDVPLIGTTQAAGATPSQLSMRIREALTRYVVKPSVSVNVVTYAGRNVTVEGEVNNPGIFPYQNGMTLLSAMALAKSTSDVARSDEISVIRTRPDGRYLGVFNLEAIRAGQAPDIQLQPSDYVVVGRSGRREFWKNFIQTAPLLGLFMRF